MPTTKAAIVDRLSIGRCIEAHREHFVISVEEPEASDAGFVLFLDLNTNVRPFEAFLPQRSQASEHDADSILDGM